MGVYVVGKLRYGLVWSVEGDRKGRRRHDWPVWR